MAFDSSNIVDQFLSLTITPLLSLIFLPQFPQEGKMIHIIHDLSLNLPLLLLLLDLPTIDLNIQFLLVLHQPVNLSHHDLLGQAQFLSALVGRDCGLV